METLYPLEWFDNLILVKLAAQKNNRHSITQMQSDEIIKQANMECLKIQAYMKSQAFANPKLEGHEELIRQYHSSLILLHDHSLVYRNHLAFSTEHLQKTMKCIVSKIDELLCFIECWFPKYLSLEDRAPHSYLSLIRSEIREKLPTLKSKLIERTKDSQVIHIIINRLLRFSDEKTRSFDVTFRDLFYKKELLKNLHELKESQEQEFHFTSLDKLLIYLNYNSKTYINYLIHRIEKQVKEVTSIDKKINHLSLSFKFFKQLLRKPDVKLNPKFHDLDSVMNNWFKQELAYLKTTLDLSATLLGSAPAIHKLANEQPKIIDKILCMLSSDQISLIIRALDDLRIIKAKSMNAVFKTIVPHLSTLNKVELSYSSVRSKSYNPEDREKEQAIKALQRVIKKIEEY